MAITLSAPVTLSDIARFMEQISRGFGRSKGYSLGTQVVSWTPKTIEDHMYYHRDVDSHLYHLYDRLSYSSRNQLDESAHELGATVEVFYRQQYSMVTRIIDKTMFIDFVNGQTFPPSTRDFIIYTYRCEADRFGYIKEFIKFRNDRIKEAQQRINNSIPKTPYSILTGK